MRQKHIVSTVASVVARGDEPEILITTSGVDREADEILAEGGDFAAYRQNPVVMFGHDYHAIPVGTTTALDVRTGGIRARWKWLEGDEFAARVRNAWEQGVLRAASIGFAPHASEPNGRGGRRYTKWELLEWSIVPVPANPEAVRVLRSLDLWADEPVLDIVDDEPAEDVIDVVGFTDAELQRLARSAAAHRRRRGEPFGDPAIRRHEELADVDREDVRAAVVNVVRETLTGLITEETAAALRRMTGRVD